ncbi:MAG: hypothetical protein J2P49_07920 [Methylocapsa sp.]|nr:hypothetical protein [Methylocapsa sp.]
MNTSKTPALISYWELVWGDRRFGWTFFERCQDDPDDGYCDITVREHSRYVLSFEDSHDFARRHEIDNHRVALFLKLYIADRKSPMWLRVWKSDG